MLIVNFVNMGCGTIIWSGAVILDEGETELDAVRLALSQSQATLVSWDYEKRVGTFHMGPLGGIITCTDERLPVDHYSAHDTADIYHDSFNHLIEEVHVVLR